MNNSFPQPKSFTNVELMKKVGCRILGHKRNLFNKNVLVPGDEKLP